MATGSTEIDFVITRAFDAPRERVFEAWSEAGRLAQWWGPKGLGLRVVKLEFTPGGIFHYAMVMPNGAEMFGRFTYDEIAAPERIVFINGFADADGNFVSSPMLPGWPREVANTVTFTEQGGKTTLALRGTPRNASEVECAMFASMHASMTQGFAGTFDKLAEYLAKP